MKPLEEERNNGQETLTPDRKVFIAICIAAYQLFLPRLLAVIAGTVIVAYLMLWFWSR